MLLAGLTPQCTCATQPSYKSYLDAGPKTSGTKEAEMAWLLRNTSRHVNIALPNERVPFPKYLATDLTDTIEPAETRPFRYTAFQCRY
jgi:UDP-N-acetyl-D-mannosaminuronate dehydrogenase